MVRLGLKLVLVLVCPSFYRFWKKIGCGNFCFHDTLLGRLCFQLCLLRCNVKIHPSKFANVMATPYMVLTQDRFNVDGKRVKIKLTHCSPISWN
jgi:hypothetical protein